jgi:hypothetical protein
MFLCPYSEWIRVLTSRCYGGGEEPARNYIKDNDLHSHLGVIVLLKQLGSLKDGLLIWD